MIDDSIRMRDDLALEGLSVPASRAFKDYDTQVDVVYISAEELVGATYGDDPAHPDDHPFCYVQLKDGRSLYFLSVDLDFGEMDGDWDEAFKKQQSDSRPWPSAVVPTNLSSV